MEWIRDILEICAVGVVCLAIWLAVSFAKSLWDDKEKFKAVIVILVLSCAGFWLENLMLNGSNDKGYLAGYEAGFRNGYEHCCEDLSEDNYNIYDIKYDDRADSILRDMNDVGDNGHEW